MKDCIFFLSASVDATKTRSISLISCLRSFLPTLHHTQMYLISIH